MLKIASFDYINNAKQYFKKYRQSKTYTFCFKKTCSLWIASVFCELSTQRNIPSGRSSAIQSRTDKENPTETFKIGLFCFRKILF
jgi:hypothetical protein